MTRPNRGVDPAPSVAFTVPYRFDTTTTFRGVLRFAAWLQVVVIIGIIYSVVIRHDLAGAVQLSVCALLIAGFGVLFLRHGEGAVGTIERDAVTVERGEAVLGLRFPGPSGRFALARFSAVRAEESSGPIDAATQGGAHARIYLVGKDGTSDILIARIQGVGTDAGREFAATLGLPFRDERVNY